MIETDLLLIPPVFADLIPSGCSRTPPLASKGSVSLHRNLSMPASTPRPTLTVKMMDQQQGQVLCCGIISDYSI